MIEFLRGIPRVVSGVCACLSRGWNGRTRRLLRPILSTTITILLLQSVFAEEPYQYSSLSFNKGMASAGAFLGEQPEDVTNGLWDATGFLYPRNAFKLFNGRTRILGNVGIGGMYRYVRRADYPLFTAQSNFLVADSQFIWQDSSVTDSVKAFKLQPIGTSRGTAATTSGSKRVVGGSVTKWLQYVIPKDPFLGGIIDSATYFRMTSAARIKVDYVLSDDTIQLASNAGSTVGSSADYKLFPALDTSSQKFFTGNANTVWFGDSTKPVWAFDGGKTPVSYVVDSGRIYAAVTTLLRDNTKVWFPNQWRSYWVRFAHRRVQDRGGAGGADSMVLSPWAPIISNDDTSLTLRFDVSRPTTPYGAAGSTYYIMAFPIERLSGEQTVTALGTPVDSIFRSSTTGFNFGDADNAITSWPLSVFFTSGAGTGQIKMVSAVYGDSIFLLGEKATAGTLNSGTFVLVENTPIIARLAITHQDRNWYVDQSNPNRLYYSEPLEPGNVGPFNYIDVFPREGDIITNLASYQDQLLVYKNNSIDRVVGDNPSNFIALPFLENIGTPGINTRASFAGDEYFYDYRTGIYVLRQFNPVRLSDPIRPMFDSIPSAAAKNAALAIFRDHLWFSYPSGNAQTKNNRLISYNVRVPDSWSRHTFNRCANFAIWPQVGDSTRFVCGDPDSGLVYVYNDTARIDAYQSTRIKLTYKTGWLPFAGPELRKQFRGFHLGFEADTISGSAGDIDSVYLYKDFSTTPFDTLLFSREGQLENYVAKDINREGLGRLFQLEMRIAPRTTFRLHFARTKWAVTGERQ